MDKLLGDNRGVVVLGAGGHAKVCIELLRGMGKEVAFCVAKQSLHETCLGVPILRGDHELDRLLSRGHEKAFIAIGDNDTRKRIADDVVRRGFSLENAISSNAAVSPSVDLGLGVAIMGGATVNSGSKISDLAIINTGSVVDHDCAIGEAAHVGPGVSLAGGVAIGGRVLLGVGSSVIPGQCIGDSATVGAGSVVIGDVAPGVTVVGVPAKRIG